MAALRYGSVHDKADVADDIVGDIVCEYLSLPEFDKPQSLHDYQVWCYRAARKFRKRYARDKKAISIESAYDHLDNVRGESALDMLMSGSVMHRQRPHQEVHMEVRDAFRGIAMLPEKDARLVVSVIDHGNVAEYAKDRGVSLFDAMSDLTRARMLMNRLRDDDADERAELDRKNHID